MKCKHKTLVYKIVFRISLTILITVLWTTFAVIVYKAYAKFRDEPVGTEISYKVGHLRFPIITICHYAFVQSDPIWKNCSLGATHYVDALKNCMDNPDIFQSIPKSWKDFSSDVQLTIGQVSH